MKKSKKAPTKPVGTEDLRAQVRRSVFKQMARVVDGASATTKLPASATAEHIQLAKETKRKLVLWLEARANGLLPPPPGGVRAGDKVEYHKPV